METQGSWKNLADFLKCRRELAEYLDSLDQLEKELEMAKRKMVGNSKYRILNISFSIDKKNIDCEELSSQLLTGSYVDKGKFPQAVKAREAFSNWVRSGELNQILSKQNSESRIYPIWCLWGRELTIINDGDNSISFDTDLWESSFKLPKQQQMNGTVGKFFSNISQFDSRIIEKQRDKCRSEQRRLADIENSWRDAIRDKLLQSENISVVSSGSQCPRDQYVKIRDEVTNNPDYTMEPCVWVIGTGQRNRPTLWCKRCITNAFVNLQSWDESRESNFAPLHIKSNGEYDCFNDECKRDNLDIVTIDGNEILNIGFSEWRNEKRIIEVITIGLESSLTDIEGFRKKFGTSVVIDGRINL